MATPKAAFQRPMVFNERILSDTFYVWDMEETKYAVTHIIDAFSLYQIATAAKDPASDISMELIRDRWVGVFGPPAVLMTDQGSEFKGELEQLLATFGVFHEMVPPTAHWRMSLAERHGAVLKVLLMKIIKEQSIVGLGQLQMAVIAATAARNSQARVSGFSPTQLVFGKDTSMPTNLMEALAGQFHYQLARPTSPEDSFFRASQIRKAASDAFQWMEASDALKKAAGSRARLPKLELLTEGAQVMFWEPPAHRRGLSRRLQDNVSWLGPAVVAAIERKDGSIKRVWIRYKNKLKGVPLEFVRLAVAEEHEATSITKEALSELSKQLDSGRVNAEVPDSSSSSSSSTEEEAATGSTDAKKKVLKTVKKDKERSTDQVRVPDPRYPVMEMSDEEDEGNHPVSAEQMRKASSPLDDVPISIHRQQVPASKPSGGSNRPVVSSRPIKKARTHEGARADPSSRPFLERRGMFDKALNRTEEHFRSMRQKLEPKTVQIAVPTQQENPEVLHVNVRNDDPPYVNLEKFNGTEYSDSDADLMEALERSLTTEMLQHLPVVELTHMRRRPTGEQAELGRSALREMDEPVLVRRVSRQRYTLEYKPASPLTRSRLPPPPGHVMNILPESMKRPLVGERQWEILRRQRQDPPPQKDYWMLSPEKTELYRIHVVPRFHLFDVLAFHQEKGLNDPHVDPPKGIPRSWITGARTTQVYYVNNPLEPHNYVGYGPVPQSAMFMHPTVANERMSELIADSVRWTGWNTQQNLLGYWQGVTRFQVQDPDEAESHLVHWLEARHFAEDAWRAGQDLVHQYRELQLESGWPNETLMTQHLANVPNLDVNQVMDIVNLAKDSLKATQLEMQEIFFNFVHLTNVQEPTPHAPHQGQVELTHLPEEPVDTTLPATGKVRLELQWSNLSPVWQKAFEQPIKDALDIYFKHDALAPVMPNEVVDASEILPSRFVLVNKTDPRNQHPTDADLPDAKLKARLVIAGHMDQRAGDFETEAPTASLLAHNLLCFLAAQWSWKMTFADISAAFLQGDYLPAERRVLRDAQRIILFLYDNT